MNDLTKILTVSSLAFAVALAFPGCGESSSAPSGNAHPADDGHDHSNESERHDDHDHAEGDHNEHDEHDHGQMRLLGSVTIAGATLAVSIAGEIEPSSHIEVELKVTAGPVPPTVRFWIGDQAGVGALKSKADGHDDHFHGQTEVPATLTGASLWIEVETADGKRQSETVPLE